ncbi:MAG: sulfotransferase domain-containing protein [Pseudomonadota bacterium]
MRTPTYTLHDGFRMPMGFPIDGFTSALRYRSEPDDIFISTYPKCGTTWMQRIVYLIMHDGAPLPADQTMTTAIPHLEEVGSAFIDSLERPRIIKTHLPFDLSPHHPNAKVIYVARNPFDCAVSFYHHTRGFVNHYDFAEGTFDDYVTCFIRGEVDFGDYFDNVSSWLDHGDEPNFLLLTYEAMQRDLVDAIRRVGTFLGVNGAQDRDILARIVRHASFGEMAKNQQRWSSARPTGMTPFVRKGIVGDWQNHFSPTQTSALLARWDACPMAERMRALWPEIFEAAAASATS